MSRMRSRVVTRIAPNIIVPLILLLLTSLSLNVLTTTAFTPPSFGIGSVLFPVRGSVVEYISESPSDNYSKRAAITDASEFFVDAFWTGKVGGGATQLSERQRQNLEQSQTAEFTKRYGNSSGRRLSELIVCRDTNDDIIGCAGVEVDRIPDGYIKGPTITQAPLMSNLAISKSYRRRGLGEKLVYSVEELVRKEWGYEECYLYVEERNRGAVQLYSKLGYKIVWKDANAKTLLPTSDGNLQSTSTTLLCMRKDLYNRNNFLNQLFLR